MRELDQNQGPNRASASEGERSHTVTETGKENVPPVVQCRLGPQRRHTYSIQQTLLSSYYALGPGDMLLSILINEKV